jgi:hypothetical protein
MSWRRLSPLAAFLGGPGVRPDVVDVHRPDELAWTGEPQVLDSETRFIIKAGFPVALDVPAILSPMADF